MAAPDPYIGAVLKESFKIKRQIGEGGMGAIYYAEHLTLDREIAVKVLLPESAQKPSVVARFRNESRVVAALCKEWKGFGDRCILAPVEDEGVFNEEGAVYDGLPYFTLQYLDGFDLGKWTKRVYETGRYTELPDVLSIIAQVCCGLEVCHQARIVHRDLSPGNIFIAPTLINPLQVKLLDFGIARLSETPFGASDKTRATTFLGKPHYAAPEQVHSVTEVDTRADLYALGVVLYKTLCYRLPYKPKFVAHEKEDGTAGATLERTPIIHPCAIRDDLPKEWGDLVMQMMSFEAIQRPASALAIAHRLAKTLPPELADGLSILRTVAPLLTIQKWVERSQKMLSPFVVKDDSSSAETRKHLRRHVSDYQSSQGAKILDAHAAATVREELPSEELSLGTLSSVASENVTAQRPHGASPRQTGTSPPPRRVSPRWPWMLLAGVLTTTATVAIIILIGQPRTSEAPRPSRENHANRTALEPKPAPLDAGRLALAKMDASEPRPDASLPDAGPALARKPVKKRGKLWVKAHPWGRIYVDGKSRGASPKTIRLTEGKHRVTLKGPKGKSKTFDIVISDGKSKTIRHTWD